MSRPFLMTTCALAAGLALQATAHAADEPTLGTVKITAKRAHRVSKGATGLAMEVKDTPQTISHIDQEDMADFGLSGSNDALGLATGITVEQYETNRATFISRGFEIQLTQVDGLGMTNSWGNVVGKEDTFLYDRIEIIRGANGLLTGVGNASGTINYIRKRPKNEDGGMAFATFGSYGQKRAGVDYNKVLTEDGRWAGRLVAVTEDKNSWIRSLNDKRSSIYGVVDGQIGDKGVLTLGLTAVDQRQKSPMWGSLTVQRSDGTQADFPTSSSTSQDWTYWNTKSYNAFAEYTHKLAGDWEAKVSYNYRHGRENTRLLYAYVPTDAATLNPDDTGLVGWPYRSTGNSDNQVLDANLNGSFLAFGRRHTLLVGASQSRQKTAVDTYAATDHMLEALPAFPYGGNVYTEPTWGAREPSTRGEQTLTRLYAATRLTVTDRLHAVLGVNAVHLKRSGASIYGNAATNTVYPNTDKTSPYAGLTYDITPDILGYVSWSTIFQNQDQTDIKGEYLAPMKGTNTEAGVKAEWLNRALLTTASVFTAKQNNLATFAGTVNDATSAVNGQSWYVGKDVKSRGYELEATGRVARDTKLTLGYTRLMLTGPDGNDIYEWVPRHTVNFRADTRLPMLRALKIGAGGRWQSETSRTGAAHQGAFLTANVFAAYDLTDKATVRLNVNNVFGKKYLTGLAYGAIYGAPRNASLTFEYKL